MTACYDNSKITVATLPALCAGFREVIGASRFDMLVDTFHPETTRGLPSYNLHRAKAHPFAIAWHGLQSDLDRSVQAGGLMLSDESLFLLDYLVRLQRVRMFPGIERILQNFSDANSYHSALFEVFVLTLFVDKGMEVKILEESKTDGQRMPDFKVITEQGEVYVECKSLDDKEAAEERIWSQLEGQIVKLLTKTQNYWHVTIRARRTINGTDIATIMSYMKQVCAARNVKVFTTLGGAMDISFKTIGSDRWQAGAFVAPRNHERSWWELEQQIFCNVSFYRRVVGVECETFFDAHEASRVEGLIKSGYGQLQADHPGVVFVQIPNRRGKQFLAICDGLFQRIFGTFPDRTRLNAVVLSARTLDRNATEYPFLDYFSIIPNINSKIEFPNDFELVGAEKMRFRKKSDEFEIMEWDLIEDEGGLALEFGLDKDLHEQLGRHLLYYCSRDGSTQIRVWQSYHDEFRVDIVWGKLGMRTFKTSSTNFDTSIMHKLAFSWSKDGKITVAADGKLLTQRDEEYDDEISIEQNPTPTFDWSDSSTEH